MYANVQQRQAAEVTGEGPPLVLVHGFGCDQYMWDAMMPHLDGFQVLRYDLTGMGRSDYDSYDAKRHGSLQGHALDLVDLLDELQVEDVVAVGHSVSAMIVAMAAKERPDLFRSLVMLCPNPYYLSDGEYDGGFTEDAIQGLLAAIDDNYAGWAGQLASMVGGDEASRETLENRFCRNDPEIMRHFAKLTFMTDCRNVIEGTSHPTLVIENEEDAIAPVRVGDYVARVLSNGSRVRLSDRGHAPHMTSPEETAKAIREFVSQ